MTKLPFVVEPRLSPITELIGTEESGKIAVERRGYLTSGEKSFVQQVLQHDNSTGELINLARKVSKKIGLRLDEAYDLVLKVISNSAEGDERAVTIENEFSEDISLVIQSLTNAQAKEELLTATCLLRYRVNDEIEVDDVVKLHPDIISGLAKLYKEEEAKSIERLEAANSSVDGAVEPEKKRSRRTAAVS